MPPWRRLLALGALTLASSSACAQSDTSRTPALAPESALRSGRYEDALAGLQRRLAADSNDMAAARLQLGTLFLLARAAEAESLGVRYAGRPGGTAVLTLLGRVQRSRGRDSAARASFERAIAARAPDSLRARLELARLDFDASSGAAAMAAFGSFIDIYNARAASLGAHELLAVALACRYLGRDQPSLYRDALRALDQALARDTSDDEATLEVAALFLDKYNFADAKATLDPLLARNPRHPLALGLMARLRRLEGRGGVGGGDALTPLTRALEVAPDHADLRALEAMVLLDHERFDDARAAAQRALQADATHATALAALEAVRLLRGDSSGALAVPAGITARSPDEVAYFSTLAEIAGRNRLYRQAADFARRALTADTADAKALALLGSNLLRVGAIGEGRERLELAFARDPYDVWTKNTLDLLDTAPQYEELEGEHVTLVVEKQDAALVSLYALPLAERAFAALASRYQWRPAGRVRIELYRSDADFSVRTVGLAGLDALGVSFGPVVALLAPAARDPGRYNWGSTLWHELAHTFTLGASAHRVPRWLSEGLSVYEERRAEPAWGADVTASFLQAFLANRLAPASRLNDGFMRPAYPEQVPFSYYQASIVCELIERHHGIAGLRRMLGAFAEGKSSDEVFRQVLRIEPRAMDSLFVRYVRDRFAGQLAAVMPKGDPGEGSDFERALARARERRNAGQTSEAIEELRRAKAMFPGYVGADAPSRQLAELYERSGDSRAALGELGELAAVDEDGYATNRKLAALALSLGDTAAAAAALDRVMYMHPYDAAAHAELAGLSLAAGDFDRAVRERRAAVALNPPDLLEARYQLAATLFAAGRREDARRELLRLLDSAPHFAKAQDLLLRLRAAPQEG